MQNAASVSESNEAGLRLSLDPARSGPDAQRLASGLRQLVVGQDEAVRQIAAAYQMVVAGIREPGRPAASFLLLGPTGTGKTRIVEATAQSLLGNPRAVVKVDCAEFQHSHEIAKLIGSPPGYLGHRETLPALSQEALDRHHIPGLKLGFVLFDEIEKASDALWNLLLGILDKAELRLGDNRVVNFSRTMIFMTGNLGAAEMSRMIAPRLGFLPARETAVAEELGKKVEKAASDAARRRFTPEFINRIDSMVVFRPLARPELRQVLDIELKLVQERIFSASTPFGLSLTEAAKTHLLEEGLDSRYGARHLKRSIERLLVQPISNLVASEQVRERDWIRVDYDPEANSLKFLRAAEHVPAEAAPGIEITRQMRSPEAAAGAQARPERGRRALVGEVTFGE
jgi:ATP-dependent Clp protease ATP-binding subunit ClpA